MKYSYLYSGLQAAFVFSGLAVLPTGVPTSVDEDVHKALSKNKFAKHLINSGDLTVTEIAEDALVKATGKGAGKTSGKGKTEGAASDAAKAAGEAELATVQAELTELGITFADDETLEQLQAKLTQAKE
ncbi:hypothetical protein KTH46_07655 [Acinetobacter bereziniae]|uniref:hypothetical protein n=1 Tax=Acinetobacter bereziniae TaxID=106648 RepID=UPI0021D2A07B|nr:hypothetical protein [Acinetobacter bereziniae]MCU4314897.1 hypothetical protein [Acinetobacter bereziniae]